MKSVLEEYSFRYSNTMRPHQKLGQRIPASTTRKTSSDASKVVAIPVLGGLHHDYRAAA
jgi:putative transposase